MDELARLRRKFGRHQTRPPIQCPVCGVTLRPETIKPHFLLELERLQNDRRRGLFRICRPSSLSSSVKKDLPRNSIRTVTSAASSELAVVDQAKLALSAVRRKRLLFESQSHDQAGPSHCPGCRETLSMDEDEATAHVSSCLATYQGPETSDEEGSVEEYTWCNITRVRTTSMLDPRTRADFFNGTVISTATEDDGCELDVTGDNCSEVYGPSQYDETDIILATQGGKSPIKGESPLTSTKTPIQCLICMGMYQDPVVSVQCWHVFCEPCWLQAMGAQKLCPKCKTITTPSHLRRIFL